MQTNKSKLAQVIAISAVAATAFALPANAYHHHHKHHHHHHAGMYRPLTVAGPTADPFNGPAAIVTAPVAILATAVSVPFRAANALFPATPSSPLVVIGAPAHFAGQVVNFPFWVVGNAFGAPYTY